MQQLLDLSPSSLSNFCEEWRFLETLFIYQDYDNHNVTLELLRCEGISQLS